MVEQYRYCRKKNGSLRLCLDPKPFNEAIKRERHNIPTPADVQSQLSGKTIFTVVDMKDGYWHVKLSDESSYYYTFNTPWGRKRFLPMPFVISSASEVMQKRNEETFGDISGDHVIADDLIIAAATEKEHDAILRKVLYRARDKGVRFNFDKIDPSQHLLNSEFSFNNPSIITKFLQEYFKTLPERSVSQNFDLGFR